MENLNLTQREQKVLDLVSQGCDNVDIAKKLNLSESTVSTYISNIYRKMGVTENKGRGGKRDGAGRPVGTTKENSKKLRSYRLSDEEDLAVKELIKNLRNK